MKRMLEAVAEVEVTELSRGVLVAFAGVVVVLEDH